MTVPPPCFVSLPCAFRSRNLADSPLVRRRNLRRPLRSVPLRPCRRVRVRFARGWIKISRRFVKPPTGRPSMPEPLSARPSSKPRSNGSRRWSVFASNNSFGARPRPPRRRLRRPRMRPRRYAATSAARPATWSARSEATRLLPPSGRRRPSSPSTGEVPLLAVWSAVRRLPRHRGFHHPGDRSPGPSPSRSPPPLSTYLLMRCSFRHRHGPAAGPADSQEHPGGLDLGGDPLG